jgi:uncharacterized NAD(P)/FAD-binding protein YdhS
MTTIAIIGSGPSAIYALQALLNSPRALDITMFEAGDTAGFGTPYDPRWNSVEMLANIASVEIPPIGITLVDYLAQCGDAALDAVGVSRDALGDRDFFPRVALGAYYRDRLSALVSQAGENGHTVTVLTQHRVVDAIPLGDSVNIRYVDGSTSPLSVTADKVIVATGHVVPGSKTLALADNAGGLGRDARAIGILGSSLSAIDVAVSVAAARGRFVDGRYELAPNEMPFSLTMMSRGGRLPEADFYCPLPAVPAEGFTHHDVAALVDAVEPRQRLDVVFSRFASVLASADPAYAARISLESLTADSFPTAYFAERDSNPAFVWARLNLEEAERNHGSGHVVKWRYTILRCHEAFAACLDLLTPEDLKRFDSGLKRVFADNYAAVPPASIKRLLALHDAGVLHVVKLADDYDVTSDEEGDRSVVNTGGSTMVFDRIVDARGQALADEDEFPFPSLRMIMKANRDIDDTRDGGAVTVDKDFRLVEGANPLGNVWCLSLPFLLDRKPFIQGLTSACEMGRAAADAIIADIERPIAEPPNLLAELIDVIATTQPIILADQAVVLAPRTADPKSRRFEAQEPRKNQQSSEVASPR